MNMIHGYLGREKEITDLFYATFSASEGADEGRIVSKLAADLMETTSQDDLYTFSACDKQDLVGCIFFSRLTYELDERTVFILAPVAVRTDQQNRGIGQKLINYGLAELRKQNIAVVLTYGDPNFYAKVGFEPIAEDFARAPYPLSLPHGWLGQSLKGKNMEPLKGPSSCVPALDHPDLW